MPILPLRNIVAISLVFVFCFQIFIKIWIVQYYQLNKDFISTVLCINQDKPEMKCDGKCYLKKQLAKQEEQENKSPTSIKEKIESLLFLDASFQASNYINSISLYITFPTYNFGISACPIFGIFHPPKVV